MNNLLQKEFRLSTSLLTYCFIGFGLMFFLPGYPILCGAFFVTLGIYKSIDGTKETNDILFSALLPIAKRDVVKGKYLLACFIELCSLLIMAVAVLIRMTLLSDSAVYRENFMMNANFFALGVALVIFGVFNLVFLGGFFKTAYKTGIPFITHIVICFTVIGISEALHHFPSLDWLNSFGFEHLTVQLLLFFGGMVLFSVLTILSYIKSCKCFEKIDL